MARILITGGAGYAGSIITGLALQYGHYVKVIDALWFNKNVPALYAANSNYKFVRVDIRDIGSAESILKDIDFVIHTAAVVGEPACKKFPDLTRQINYDASINLISKAAEYGVKGFIFFSTCSNYGISKGAADEKTQSKPLSLYAQTKVDVESHLTDNCKNIDWVICRLSTLYGLSPRMRFDLTVNDFTMNAYMKKYLDIFLPQTYRPYIHVYDAGRIVMEIIENFQKTRNNIFNIGFNTENYRKIQIAEIVKGFLPQTTVKIVKKGTDLRNYQVDFSKIESFLGIKNRYTVREGIGELLMLLKSKRIKDPYESCYYNTIPNFGETECQKI